MLAAHNIDRLCHALHDTHGQVSVDAPDPGVQFLGGRWVMTSTGGAPGGGAFAIRESDDLVHWREAGSIFSADDKPGWSDGVTYWVSDSRTTNRCYFALRSVLKSHAYRFHR